MFIYNEIEIMLRKSFDNLSNTFKRHIWPVYLNCKAGGVVGNPLGGAVVDFQFLLTGERDSLQLNAAYNWIKCNRDFDGYYISDYYKTLWESFEAVLLSSPEV